MEAISTPMYPPPTTIIFSGIVSKAKAPVEESTVFSSKGKNGNGIETEPVAKIILRAMICSSPLSVFTLI